MKTLLLLAVSSGFVFAQPRISDNCSPLTISITPGMLDRMGELGNERVKLQSSLDLARQKYSENHPDVVTLKQRLDLLNAQQKRMLGRKPFGLQSCRGEMWWKNEATAREVGLTVDQIKRMDDVFQQYRIKLVDLNAALEKEEIILEPLVSADQVDEAKVATEIDKIAQARAELEKANGRMLLGIRKQLTPEQWNKLNGR